MGGVSVGGIFNILLVPTLKQAVMFTKCRYMDEITGL